MTPTRQTPGRLLQGLLLAAAFVTAAPLILAQDFIWAPDFPVGSELTEIEAVDQNGELHRFDDLKGENGLLFMMSRSFDW